MGKTDLEAIYEHGVFRPLDPSDVGIEDGQRVRIHVELSSDALDSLNELTHIYDGLSDEEIAEIERIILDRSNFFGEPKSPTQRAS